MAARAMAKRRRAHNARRLRITKPRYGYRKDGCCRVDRARGEHIARTSSPFMAVAVSGEITAFTSNVTMARRQAFAPPVTAAQRHRAERCRCALAELSDPSQVRYRRGGSRHGRGGGRKVRMNGGSAHESRRPRARARLRHRRRCASNSARARVLRACCFRAYC